MELVDFDACELSYRTYEGNAGRKRGIIWRGDNWLIKYPENTAGMRGHVLSYTTSPVSEWLGSHIYALAGIDVHQTVLGISQGKLVCACRDFCPAGVTLATFKSIKNSDPRDRLLPDGSASSGNSTYLSDVLETLVTSPILSQVEGAVDRFWEMFVVDALIRNTDRNNTNWGLLRQGDGPSAHMSLAPVYDNGNSFYNKRTLSRTQDALLEEGRVEREALRDVTSIFLDDTGKKIQPFDYMARASDPHLIEAIGRIANQLDLSQALSLIDELPQVACGAEIMPDDVRAFHRRCLVTRWERGVLPIVRQAEN